MTNWVSEQFLNVNQERKKLQAQLFHRHGSMGHWQWPVTHVTHPKMVTHLTHDPLTHWPISISAWQYRLTHVVLFYDIAKMLKCLNVDSWYATTIGLLLLYTTTTTTTTVTVWWRTNQELVYSETWRTASRATPTPIPVTYNVRIP